ncbi:conserved hypothetical protein [Mesorhizobium prunaredense]|uniref:Uncharacterized protein n=1 Tax=Mesorhizobium prunaredense TaxID=1631249 RepID=A0A1R3VLY2_9HYPH|nr:conserved hypothetical protein [Mesorhizobium prunaredense]
MTGSGQGIVMRIEVDELPPLPDGERVAGAKRRSGEGAVTRAFVILGRSKERSDAAQTLGSMPLPPRSPTVRNVAPCLAGTSAAVACLADILHRLGLSAEVTEWILGSTPAASRRLRPRMTKARYPERVPVWRGLLRG